MMTGGSPFNICWGTMEGVVNHIILIQDLALSYNRPQISPKHISIDKIGQSSGTGVTTYDNDTIILISIL